MSKPSRAISILVLLVGAGIIGQGLPVNSPARNQRYSPLSQAASSSTDFIDMTPFLNVSLVGAIPKPPGTSTFTSFVTGGDGNYSYAWAVSGGVDCSDLASPVTTCSFPPEENRTNIGQPIESVCLTVTDTSLFVSLPSGATPWHERATSCGTPGLGSLVSVTAESNATEGIAVLPVELSAHLSIQDSQISYFWYFTPIGGVGSPYQGEFITTSFSSIWSTAPNFVILEACHLPSALPSLIASLCDGLAYPLAVTSAIVYSTPAPPTPILLIHGIWSNATNAWEDQFNFASRLRSRCGCNVWLFDYSTPVPYLLNNNDSIVDIPYLVPLRYGSADDTAKIAYDLAKGIDVMKASLAVSKIDIVAHSKGGLVARWYLQEGIGSVRKDVEKLVMLGTPNHGGPGACVFGILLVSPYVCQLAPGSSLLNELNTGNPTTQYSSPDVIADWGVKYYTICGDAPSTILEIIGSLIQRGLSDGIVPLSSCMINNSAVRDATFDIGHTGLTDSSEVMDQVVSFLDMLPSSSSVLGQMPYDAPNSPYVVDEQYLRPEINLASGSVVSGQTILYDVQISLSNSSLFLLNWEGGAMSLSLLSPNGTAIARQVPGVVYLNGTGPLVGDGDVFLGNNPGFVAYYVTGMQQGLWRCNIRADQAGNYSFIVVPTSSPNMNVFLSQKHFVKVDQQEFIGTTVVNGTTPVLGLQARASIADPNRIQASMDLLDSSNNGTYVNGIMDTAQYGDYIVVVNVTGALGGVVFTRILPTEYYVDSFDFSVEDSGNIAVPQGSSSHNEILLALLRGLPQPVTLSCKSGLPSGTKCAFSNFSNTPSFSSGLTIQTSISTPTGSYIIVVGATSNGHTQTDSFTLTVSPSIIGAIFGMLSLAAPYISLAAIALLLAIGTRHVRRVHRQNRETV